MNRAELKAKAKAQIKGKIGIMFLITLIIGAISGAAAWVISLIPVVGRILATVVVAPAFALSVSRILLGITADVKPTVKDAFSGFDDYWSAIKLHVLVGLYTFLWSLLFVIPGIIKAIAYSMSTFVLAENKGMSARACIKASKEMTKGHKGELFVLELSFIGWFLLCFITLGIASIWVGPFMQVTFANAYNALKPQAETVVDAAVVE